MMSGKFENKMPFSITVTTICEQHICQFDPPPPPKKKKIFLCIKNLADCYRAAVLSMLSMFLKSTYPCPQTRLHDNDVPLISIFPSGFLKYI
jgi:hypothetical protein